MKSFNIDIPEDLARYLISANLPGQQFAQLRSLVADAVLPKPQSFDDLVSQLIRAAAFRTVYIYQFTGDIVRESKISMIKSVRVSSAELTDEQRNLLAKNGYEFYEASSDSPRPPMMYLAAAKKFVERYDIVIHDALAKEIAIRDR